jgi:hypothetical protein
MGVLADAESEHGLLNGESSILGPSPIRPMTRLNFEVFAQSRRTGDGRLAIRPWPEGGAKNGAGGGRLIELGD